MTVAHILTTKGNEVFTISEGVTLKEAIDVLAKRRVGAVVVADSARRVLGILSERDVVRAVSLQGQSAFASPASAWMTREVITCSLDTTVPELMDIMTKGRFRHVPVLRDGILHGIVSIGDVVKRRIAEIEHEAEDLRTYIAS